MSKLQKGYVYDTSIGKLIYIKCDMFQVEDENWITDYVFAKYDKNISELKHKELIHIKLKGYETSISKKLKSILLCNNIEPFNIESEIVINYKFT